MLLREKGLSREMSSDSLVLGRILQLLALSAGFPVSAQQSNLQIYGESPLQYIDEMAHSGRWSVDLNFGARYYLKEPNRDGINGSISLGSDLRFSPLAQTIGGSIESLASNGWSFTRDRQHRIEYGFGWIRLRSFAGSRSYVTYAGGIGKHRLA